ncbi:hypothetical protein MMC17_005435 [Xylographa soralifera]|nr:hypothetical protein [Xylographa soralifera]
MTQLLAIKLFTGAPEAGSLQWDSEALTAPLLPCFAPGHLSVEPQALRQTEARPVWRSLPLHNTIAPGRDILPDRVPRTTALTAENSFDTTSPSFPTTQNLSFASTTSSPNNPSTSAEPTNALSQFYEHSFALHEAIPSSQLLSPHSSACTSFLTTTSSPSDSYTEPPTHLPLPIPDSTPLTPLRALPSASHILSLHPQTPTVNLLICILSLPPPRLIHPRRGGPPLLLTEMLVADDTKAGFGLNIWLPSSDSQSPNLRAVVGTLRPQDVVLARNVALSAFRGVVYGQSLRRDTTRLELMYRSGGGGAYSARDLADGGLKEGVVERVRAVRRWVMDFVGGGRTEEDRNEEGREKSVRDALMLPPDTQ